MLTEKPWRLDALVRLIVSVIICVFVGSILMGALAFSPTDAAIPGLVFYALTAGALAFAAAALVLNLRRVTLEAWGRRLVWLLLCIFFSLSLAGWAQHLAGAGQRETYSFGGVFVGALSFQGSALFLVWWFLDQHEIGWTKAFGVTSRGAARAVLLGLLFAGVLFLFELGYSEMLSLLHFKPAEQHVVQVARLNNSVLEQVFFGIVTIGLVPVSEEMLFRGILYPTIKQLGFPRAALWGTSLLFAAIHLNAASFVPLTLLAVALALLYERTNNLLAPIAAHGCFNSLNLVMLYLSQRQGG